MRPKDPEYIPLEKVCDHQLCELLRKSVFYLKAPKGIAKGFPTQPCCNCFILPAETFASIFFLLCHMPGLRKTGGFLNVGGGSSSWKEAGSSFTGLSTREALVWGGKEKLYTLLSTRRLDACSYTAEGKEEGSEDAVGPPLTALNTLFIPF